MKNTIYKSNDAIKSDTMAYIYTRNQMKEMRKEGGNLFCFLRSRKLLYIRNLYSS